MTDKKWIMAVDSEEEYLSDISIVLMKYGYQVNNFRNGMKALESIREKPYELLITDLILADMTGIDLVKAVNAFNPGIGVIIATACGTLDLYLEMITLRGSFVYLNKPIDPEKLREAVTGQLDFKATGVSS